MSKPIATDVIPTVHMVWSASVIDLLMSNCVYFGTYMPDISRDIKVSWVKFPCSPSWYASIYSDFGHFVQWNL